MPNQIFVINPGSTSTKLAVTVDGEIRLQETLRHPVEELAQYGTVWDQFEYRLTRIKDWASNHVQQCDAVATLGGLLRPMQGGVYPVNEAMLDDARANFQGEHASNLGCALADAIGKELNCPSFIVDAVSVDEFEPPARYSGHSLIERRSLSHAINIHAAARKAAEELAIPFDASSFVVAHLGGGISVAPVQCGRIIDVNDAASDGPFSPERTGGLPLQQFVSLCYSGKYSENEMRKFVMGKGGLVAYLGTNDAAEVERRISEGDDKARVVFEAMAYQIAKEIGAMATVLNGRVDAVVLTGGLAHSNLLMKMVTERVRFLGKVLIHPGEDEMRSIALGALRVLRGEEQPKIYGRV